MKNQKGITLVALVITIIVLLILAAVSIAALSGENGILTNAKLAKQMDELGAAKDQVTLKANEGINTYFKTNYVDATSGTAVTKTAQEYVIDAIKTLSTPIGNVVATYTDSTVVLTTSDGEKTVTGTVAANGSLTWGSISDVSGS